jgi:hypothetical protein
MRWEGWQWEEGGEEPEQCALRTTHHDNDWRWWLLAMVVPHPPRAMRVGVGNDGGIPIVLVQRRHQMAR